MKTSQTLFAIVLIATAFLREDIAFAHCQVPCGIYDDQARIDRLKEDAVTIEKAVSQILELNSKTDALSRNQLTRWVNTKEQHAAHIIEVVSEYFLTQKVKIVPGKDKARADYLARLADHHAVMVWSMKAKQTVDPAVVTELQKVIATLEKYYHTH